MASLPGAVSEAPYGPPFGPRFGQQLWSPRSSFQLWQLQGALAVFLLAQAAADRVHASNGQSTAAQQGNPSGSGHADSLCQQESAPVPKQEDDIGEGPDRDLTSQPQAALDSAVAGHAGSELKDGAASAPSKFLQAVLPLLGSKHTAESPLTAQRSPLPAGRGLDSAAGTDAGMSLPVSELDPKASHAASAGNVQLPAGSVADRAHEHQPRSSPSSSSPAAVGKPAAARPVQAALVTGTSDGQCQGSPGAKPSLPAELQSSSADAAPQGAVLRSEKQVTAGSLPAETGMQAKATAGPCAMRAACEQQGRHEQTGEMNDVQDWLRDSRRKLQQAEQVSARGAPLQSLDQVQVSKLALTPSNLTTSRACIWQDQSSQPALFLFKLMVVSCP